MTTKSRILLYFMGFLLLAESVALVHCVFSGRESTEKDSEDVYNSLLLRLNSPDPDVRLTAISTSGNAEWLLSVWRKVMKTDPVPEIRSTVAMKLGALSPWEKDAVFEVLLDSLRHDPHPVVRRTCLLALLDTNDKRIIPILAEVIKKDEDEFNRDQAKRILYGKFPQAEQINIADFSEWWTQVEKDVVWDSKTATFVVRRAISSRQ